MCFYLCIILWHIFVLHVVDCMVLLCLTGLAFKQTSDSVILFVVTTETVLSYNTSAKDRRVSIIRTWYINYASCTKPPIFSVECIVGMARGAVICEKSLNKLTLSLPRSES